MDEPLPHPTLPDERGRANAPALLAGFPVVVEIPVQWGEMDAYGHVNNTVVFRYFESARMAYLERCGFIESYHRDKIGAILHSTSCRFRRALFYPDTVRIGARASDVGDDRFTMAYRAVSSGQGEVVAEGTALVVAFDYTRREKAALPPRVRDGIAAVERTGER